MPLHSAVSGSTVPSPGAIQNMPLNSEIEKC
jgi:hypothetical protein